MNQIKVTVSGELACFTHPALKTERATYPVITPSACDGILRAIFWKPEIKYVVTKIEVLSDIQTTTILRKELKFQNQEQVNIQEERTQRITEVLLNPKYVIHANQIMLTNKSVENHIKMKEMFNRRVEKGQCFRQPFFGIKEYVCNFEPYNPSEHKPIQKDLNIGTMFHYYLYPETGFNKEPRFFDAVMNAGVVEIPELEERFAVK